MLKSKVRILARAAAAFSLLTAAPAFAQQWPSRVNAVYGITFNGFDIGTFQFSSSVNGPTYTLTGNAELSALLGAFTWQGATRTSGSTHGEALKPVGYTFDYKSNSRAGSVKMGFNDAGVSNLSIVPPSPPEADKVPVRDHHLKEVLDPLSAVMAISRANGNNPCGRKIPIFDGKQRFDLHLSFRRQERIAEARPSGQPGIGYVCRVRYIPVAGHRMNDETKQMSDSASIEIALRPVPSANILVPYRITVPTMAGSAVMTSKRIDIVTQAQGQIALLH